AGVRGVDQRAVVGLERDAHVQPPRAVGRVRSTSRRRRATRDRGASVRRSFRSSTTTIRRRPLGVAPTSCTSTSIVISYRRAPLAATRPRRRHDSELLDHAESIEESPLLDDPSARDAKDRHLGHAYTTYDDPWSGGHARRA